MTSAKLRKASQVFTLLKVKRSKLIRRALPSGSAEPVENTLFFAGEATHLKLMGTVQGAIASGLSAADEVLTVMNR